jgi:hypothetical protein
MHKGWLEAVARVLGMVSACAELRPKGSNGIAGRALFDPRAAFGHIAGAALAHYRLQLASQARQFCIAAMAEADAVGMFVGDGAGMAHFGCMSTRLGWPETYF